MSDSDKYVETQIGGATIIEFVNPPQPTTHKTSKITKSEWRTLFTPQEALRFRLAVKNVDGDLSFLPNGAIVDDPSGIAGVETLTWRQILQLSFDEWADAKEVSVSDSRVLLSTTALGAVGILDDMSRVSVLLQGVPL